MQPNIQTTFVPRHTNHVLHLILTLGTCGMWGFVWLAVWLYNKSTHDKVTTYTTAPVYPVGMASGRPQPQPQHLHSASCDDAGGNLMCGYPAGPTIASRWHQ